MIPFNIPPCGENSLNYVAQAVENKKICGDGPFTQKCSAWLERETGCQKVLLTTSGTHALEMAAFLCGFLPGDEVILPSYTFSSTANAFILAGARLVFVDVRPDTMNMDEAVLEAAVTPRTRAICAVHYAGVACEMDEIEAVAARHGLLVVEDAAQAMMASYKGRPLGSLGSFGCFSFHETKNYSMGEGGALLIRDEKYNERAEILREKGTDRSRYYRGQVDKYRWLGYGSSYLPSELNAAYLWGQLEQARHINRHRLACWQAYHRALAPLAEAGLAQLPAVPEGCAHNGHMYYLKTRSLDERTRLIDWLARRGVMSVFHYVPLHSAPAGKEHGRFYGQDRHTTDGSDRLLRLPMYYGLGEEGAGQVAAAVLDFYGVRP